MEAATTDPIQEVIEPNPDNSEPIDYELEKRKAAVKRFNRLFVYVPIIIAAIIALIVFGLLVGTALFGGDSVAQATDMAALQFLFNLADLFFGRDQLSRFGRVLIHHHI